MKLQSSANVIEGEQSKQPVIGLLLMDGLRNHQLVGTITINEGVTVMNATACRSCHSVNQDQYSLR